MNVKGVGRTLIILFFGFSFSTQAEELSSRSTWPMAVEDSKNHSMALFELLEVGTGNSRPLTWDALVWFGGDVHRVWLKSEGQGPTERGDGGEGELQVLYGKLISAYFDAQVGIRYESQWGKVENSARSFAVLSVQGLAPYMFEVDAGLFFSQAGDVSARFTASEDFRLTQRFISQLRVETNASSRAVSEFEIGSGINDISLGIRFRYEVLREFAPYVGVSWVHLLGETSDFARDAGEKASETTLVAGLRMWY